jgi:branched-chain amino acid transport system substrate-binding protein
MKNCPPDIASRGRRQGFRLLLVIPAVAVIAACGSSGSSSSGASSTSSASASPSVASSLFPSKPATGSVVKIGLINPEGGSAISQPEDREAAQATADYVNANLGGMAGGHKIQLVVCKQQEDVATATACANQMVQDKVAAVVVTTTGQGQAMVPIITKAGIPYTTVSGASTAELTSPNAYSWTGGFPGTLITMAKYSASKGYKNVTAYVTDSPAAIEGAKALGIPSFKAAGITLKVVGIPLGAPDATSEVSAGLGSKPQAAVVIGDSTVCTSVLQAMQTLQPSIDKEIIQPCMDPSTIKAVGSGLDGAQLFTQSDTVSGKSASYQLYLQVMTKYAPGVATQGYAITGYQGLLGLVYATKGLTGAVTPASVNAAIKSATNVPLPAGDGLTFTCNGKAIPGLTAVCSSDGLVETVQNGIGTNPQVLK